MARLPRTARAQAPGSASAPAPDPDPAPFPPPAPTPATFSDIVPAALNSTLPNPTLQDA